MGLASGLTRVGLEADAGTQLASLPGGQRTRAAIAGAVLAVQLPDEPTHNPDRKGRAALLDRIASWRGGAIVETTSLGATRYGRN